MPFSPNMAAGAATPSNDLLFARTKKPIPGAFKLDTSMLEDMRLNPDTYAMVLQGNPHFQQQLEQYVASRAGTRGVTNLQTHKSLGAHGNLLTGHLAPGAPRDPAQLAASLQAQQAAQNAPTPGTFVQNNPTLALTTTGRPIGALSPEQMMGAGRPPTRRERIQNFSSTVMRDRFGGLDDPPVEDAKTFFNTPGVDAVANSIDAGTDSARSIMHSGQMAHYQKRVKTFNDNVARMLAAHGTTPWESREEYAQAIQEVEGYTPLIKEAARQIASRFMPENLKLEAQQDRERERQTGVDAEIQAKYDAIPPGGQGVINGQIVSRPATVAPIASPTVGTPQFQVFPDEKKQQIIEQIQTLEAGQIKYPDRKQSKDPGGNIVLESDETYNKRVQDALTGAKELAGRLRDTYGIPRNYNIGTDESMVTPDSFAPDGGMGPTAQAAPTTPALIPAAKVAQARTDAQAVLDDPNESEENKAVARAVIEQTATAPTPTEPGAPSTPLAGTAPTVTIGATPNLSSLNKSELAKYVTALEEAFTMPAYTAEGSYLIRELERARTALRQQRPQGAGTRDFRAGPPSTPFPDRPLV